MDVIAVSDNYSSSMRTLAIAREHEWVIPAVGLHPWAVHIDSIDEAKRIAELALGGSVKVLGEVGLDKKFKSDSFAYQLQVFELFIDVAKEAKAVLNVHAAGAWKEAIDLLAKGDIPTAIIHWYTGPIDLLKELRDRGFYITVNPAVALQQKHREVVSLAPLDIILIESDAPYNYRGLLLHPRKIFDVINYIADLKNMSIEEVYSVISHNYEVLKTKYIKP